MVSDGKTDTTDPELDRVLAKLANKGEVLFWLVLLPALTAGGTALAFLLWGGLK
jgi:hypothetical protein